MGVPLPNRTGRGPDSPVRDFSALADATLSPARCGPSAGRIAGGTDRAAKHAVALGARSQYTVRHYAGTSQAGFAPDRSTSHPPGIGPTPKGRQ